MSSNVWSCHWKNSSERHVVTKPTGLMRRDSAYLDLTVGLRSETSVTSFLPSFARWNRHVDVARCPRSAVPFQNSDLVKISQGAPYLQNKKRPQRTKTNNRANGPKYTLNNFQNKIIFILSDHFYVWYHGYSPREFKWWKTAFDYVIRNLV